MAATGVACVASAGRLTSLDPEAWIGQTGVAGSVYHPKVLLDKGIIDKGIIRTKVLQDKGIPWTRPIK